MRNSLIRSAVISVVLVVMTYGQAQAVNLFSVDRGTYNSTGTKNGTYNNTFTGLENGLIYNSFFSFDLPTLAVPVVSGVLRLEVERYFGPYGSEPFTVYDTAPTFYSGATYSPANYYDLRTGKVYGKGIATPASVGTVLEITLSQDAISDINLAAGRRFTVGVYVENRYKGGIEGIRFSSLADARAGIVRVQELRLVTSSGLTTTHESSSASAATQ